MKSKTEADEKQKSSVSVFDLQLQPEEVARGALKRAWIFERNIDKAGKMDMPL